MLSRGITSLSGMPLPSLVGYEQSKLRESSQLIEDSSSLTWSALASPPPIQLFLRSYLSFQYSTAAFHLPLEISKTTPSSNSVPSILGILPKTFEDHAWSPPIQIYVPKTESTMLFLCVNIFRGYLMSVQWEKSLKAPSFHYRNLINLKKDGLLESEALNLKFYFSTDEPVTMLHTFSLWATGFSRVNKRGGGGTHIYLPNRVMRCSEVMNERTCTVLG